jgi:sugar lactone lactonase YvrE
MTRTGMVAGLCAALTTGCNDDPVPCDRVPGNLCALVGTGEHGFNDDGLPALEADLFLVSSAKRRADGALFVMDFNNQRLRTIDEDGRLHTVAGNGIHAIATVGIPGLDSALENPIDFDFASDGRVVFVSYHDPRVLTIGDDGILQAIAGAPDGLTGTEGNEGDGGPAEDALFIQLDGIVIAPDDTIYVSDSLANRVRRIRAGIIETVAGDGEAAYAGDGGPGPQASLHWPSALALDRQGAVYVADTRNHVVRRIDPGGTITTFAGNGTKGFGGDGGPATAAAFDQPYGLAVTEDGALFVADRGNFRIRRVGPDGIVETVAGTGENGLHGDAGPATSATFGHLARLAPDADGILVADQGNSLVRRLVLP